MPYERLHAAAAPAVPLTPAGVERIAAREAAIQAHAAVPAPPDLRDEERPALPADLEAGLDDADVRTRLRERRDGMSTPDTPADMQHLLADLRRALLRRHWSLLERVILEGDAGGLRLVRSVADRGLIEAHLLPALRAQHAGKVRVVTRGSVGLATPPAAETTPPNRIALEQWAVLLPLMRTALMDSTLDADASMLRRAGAAHAAGEAGMIIKAGGVNSMRMVGQLTPDTAD